MQSRVEPASDGKLGAIEALRFFAALLVVFYHAYFSLPVPEGSTRHAMSGFLSWFQNGLAGVDIFFVISGFVMYTASARRRVFDARAFLQDRFWRIYPVLWGALLIKIGLELVTLKSGHGTVDPAMYDPLRLVGQFLLFPMQEKYLLIAPTWTLSLEMIFYAIFALGYLRAGLRGVAIGMLLWYGINCTLGYGLGLHLSQLGDVTNPVILEFLYGAVVGWLWLTFRGRFGHVALVLGVVATGGMIFGIGWYYTLGIPREFGLGLPAACLVYGLASVNPPVPRWLLLGGRASYVLYLTGDFVMGTSVAFFAALLHVRIWNPDLQILGVLPVFAAVLFAVMMNVLLENPFQQWRRRHRKAVEAAHRGG